MMRLNKCLLVNYGVGNIFSITQALNACGYDVEISRDPKKIREASHVIFPGVGAFSHAKEKLKAFELIEPLKEYAQSGGFLLGICVGMQLLFSKSFEYGEYSGLDIIEGNVENIKKRISNVRVPVIGWQNLNVIDNNTLFNEISEPNYYFVHSYECRPANCKNSSSYVQFYDIEICASVTQGNVSGVQFHPEKSGKSGLKLLDNFMKQH